MVIVDDPDLRFAGDPLAAAASIVTIMSIWVGSVVLGCCNIAAIRCPQRRVRIAAEHLDEWDPLSQRAALLTEALNEAL